MPTLKRTLASLLCMATLLGVTRPSSACSDSDYVGKVVGVARDGTFLYHWKRTGGRGHDGGVALLAKDGSPLVADVTLDPSAWSAAAKSHPHLRAIAPPSLLEKTDALVERLAKAMSLEPLRPAPIHVAATNRPPGTWGGPCMRVEAYAAGSGSVIDLVPGDMRRCSNSHARLMSHPRSPLWFLSYRDGSRVAEVCYSYAEDTRWLPQHRLRAAAMGAVAQRMAERDPGQAIGLLQAALKLDSGNTVVRRALADLLPRAGVAWPRASKLLGVPWSKQMCLSDDLRFFGGERGSAAMLAASFRQLAGFDQEDFDRWVKDTAAAEVRCWQSYRWNR